MLSSSKDDDKLSNVPQEWPFALLPNGTQRISNRIFDNNWGRRSFFLNWLLKIYFMASTFDQNEGSF